MGSPLSPVTANFFMEKFEQKAIDSSDYKPTIWFRYVDDTFVIWSHGRDRLDDFLDHLNAQHPSIQFTMETEQDQRIAFLDVLIRRSGSKLSHTVYRKPTHTDRYLHALSNHHPSQKRGIITTLAERARRICGPQHLEEELDHLKEAFQSNGYRISEIDKAMRPRTSSRRDSDEQPVASAYLPFIPRVTDRIGKILKRHNIKTIFKPTRKIQQTLRSAKDKRDPQLAAGVYRIPCTCGKVYIGTTKRSMATRTKEHRRNCRLGQTEKSAVAEHALSEGDHNILFEEVKLLAPASGYHSRLVREAIEIHKHTDNFNRKEETLKLNQIWNPILRNTRTVPLIQKTTTTPALRCPAPDPPGPRYKYNLRPRQRQSASNIGDGSTSEEASHSC